MQKFAQIILLSRLRLLPTHLATPTATKACSATSFQSNFREYTLQLFQKGFGSLKALSGLVLQLNQEINTIIGDEWAFSFWTCLCHSLIYINS